MAAKGIVEWTQTHLDELAQASVEHLRLVGISVAVATAIALPVAILVRRRRVPTAIANWTGTFLYNIPSYALFALLVPLVGIGDPAAIVALVVFAFGIIVRNCVVGLDSVPASHLEAARGMGMTRLQSLRRVEIPHALPSIVTGVRLATVSNVAIATIAAFIGSGGLGAIILHDGVQRDLYVPPILAGFVCAAALALVIDLALIGLLRLGTPWMRAGR